jgi:hypothetical protein
VPFFVNAEDAIVGSDNTLGRGRSVLQNQTGYVVWFYLLRENKFSEAKEWVP